MTTFTLGEDAPRTMGAWVRAQCARHGDRTALEVAGTARTYREVDEYSDRMAAGLAEHRGRRRLARLHDDEEQRAEHRRLVRTVQARRCRGPGQHGEPRHRACSTCSTSPTRRPSSSTRSTSTGWHRSPPTCRKLRDVVVLREGGGASARAARTRHRSRSRRPVTATRRRPDPRSSATTPTSSCTRPVPPGPAKGVVLPHEANLNLGPAHGRAHGLHVEDDVLYTAFPLFHINARYTSVVAAHGVRRQPRDGPAFLGQRVLEHLPRARVSPRSTTWAPCC